MYADLCVERIVEYACNGVADEASCNLASEVCSTVGSRSSGDRSPTETQSEAGETSTSESWRSAQLPQMPSVVLTVRHTFVHALSESIDVACVTSERRCMSSPPSMRRHAEYCFPGEMLDASSLHSPVSRSSDAIDDMNAIPASASVQSSTSVARPSAAPGDADDISVGTLVIIQGLARCQAFNGRSGMIESWDSASGRYRVQLFPNKVEQFGRQVMLRSEHILQQSASSRSSDGTIGQSFVADAISSVAAKLCSEESCPLTPRWEEEPCQVTNSCVPSTITQSANGGAMCHPNAQAVAPFWPTSAPTSHSTSFEPMASYVQHDCWNNVPSYAEQESCRPPFYSTTPPMAAYLPSAR